MAFNKVILVGNLAADPELKQTNSGKSVTSFPVAVQRQGRDAGADFLTVVAWNGTAEFICKYFQKGKPILVEGRLQQRKWEDKDGNTRQAVEIVAEQVAFVGGKEAAEKPQDAAPATPYGKDPVQYEEQTPDDDLPF